MNRAWSLVIMGAVLEVGWVTGLKHSSNFLTWGVTIIALVISFTLFTKALSELPVGTAYAVFTGLGTAGTVLLEIVAFGEPFNIVKILLIALLLLGVIGLKVVTVTGKPEEEEVAA